MNKCIPSIYRRFSFPLRLFGSKPRYVQEVDSLPIGHSLKVALRHMGLSRMTPVQSQTFGPIASGQSCLGFARTGQGKTLAYLLPLLHRMVNERWLSIPQTTCLIALPTHELCDQVSSVLVALYPGIPILLSYGKTHSALRSALQEKPPIIIGTGRRMGSLLVKNEIDPRHLKCIVVDELDSLVMKDYLKEVQPLLEVESVQLVGMGATYSSELAALVQRFPKLRDSTIVNTLDEGTLSSTLISHKALKVPDNVSLRIPVIANLIKERHGGRVIVFVNSAAEAAAVSKHPFLVGISKCLHGGLTESERGRVLNLFRSKGFKVLICTDVAARGLDIDSVDLVVNLRPPSNTQSYIHRAGRTGRAHSVGESVLLYSSSERASVDTISKEARVKFEIISPTTPEEQSRSLLSGVVDQAMQSSFTDPSAFPLLTSAIKALSPADKAAMVSTMLHCLTGSASSASLPTKSILSGEPGFTPILLLDPSMLVFKSPADVEAKFQSMNIPVGMIAHSESGYIADVPTANAVSICKENIDGSKRTLMVEPVLLQRLPKIHTDPGVVDKSDRNRALTPRRRRLKRKA